MYYIYLIIYKKNPKKLGKDWIKRVFESLQSVMTVYENSLFNKHEHDLYMSRYIKGYTNTCS